MGTTAIYSQGERVNLRKAIKKLGTAEAIESLPREMREP
jgi:hypothetical protein